jgi:hypothetical protein
MSSSMHIQIIHKKYKYCENLRTDIRKNCPQKKIFLRVADKDLTDFGKKAIGPYYCNAKLVKIL